jgi:hypothetical protein
MHGSDVKSLGATLPPEKMENRKGMEVEEPENKRSTQFPHSTPQKREKNNICDPTKGRE